MALEIGKSFRFTSIRKLSHHFDFFTGSEQALMLGEFYRKDGDWRFMEVGQGFNGGLEALVRHFGGTVDKSPAPQVNAALATPSTKVSLVKLDVQCFCKWLILLKTLNFSKTKNIVTNQGTVFFIPPHDFKLP